MRVRSLIILVICILTVALAAGGCGGVNGGNGTGKSTAVPAGNTGDPEQEGDVSVKTFYNPISDKSMPDPFIVYHDGYYYGLATEVTVVRLYRCKNVAKLFTEGESKEIAKTGDKIDGGETYGWNLWAPELHYLPTTGRWYAYFCGSTDGFDFATMRMFCIESEGSDPFGDYHFKGKTVPDNISIDQTVWYDEASGNLYTAYSNFTSKGQAVMIARMESPWRVDESTVRMLTYPKYRWEKMGSTETDDGRVNEGPVFLTHGGRIFLIYSASGCWSEWYSLGMLEYVGPDTSLENFINVDNWIKSESPVFTQANEVYGVGHCSFFESPDGSEVWMAYHGMATPDAGVEGRYAYIQKIDFDTEGYPVFGEPVARETELSVPK